MCAAEPATPVVVTEPLTDRSMSTVIVPLPDAFVVTAGTSCLPLSTTFEPLGGGLGVWAHATTGRGATRATAPRAIVHRNRLVICRARMSPVSRRLFL